MVKQFSVGPGRDRIRPGIAALWQGRIRSEQDRVGHGIVGPCLSGGQVGTVVSNDCCHNLFVFHFYYGFR